MVEGELLQLCLIYVLRFDQGCQLPNLMLGVESEKGIADNYYQNSVSDNESTFLQLMNAPQLLKSQKKQ